MSRSVQAATANRNEGIDKGPGRPVESQHAIAVTTADIQIAVRSQRQPLRRLQATTGREDVLKSTRPSVVSQDVVCVGATDIQQAVSAQRHSDRPVKASTGYKRIIDEYTRRSANGAKRDRVRR